jgi:membrane protease YdiL (CAAX protease family)
MVEGRASMRDARDWDPDTTLTRGSVHVPWSIQDTAVATGVVFVAFLAFLLVVGFASTLLNEDQRLRIAPWFAFASEAILLYAVWTFGIGKHATGWAILGFRRLRSLRLAWLAPAALLGSMAVTGVYALTTTALGIDRLSPEPIPDELLGGGALQQTMIAAALATWVPLAEEVFFRGFLLQGVASRYGSVWGVVVSAALFSVAHMTISTALPIFGIGLILGAVYVKTRSLWIPMAAHSSQNLLAVVAALAATSS